MIDVPFFSIIIPTYNSASTLDETLKSIHIQTLLDYEVLIMDGNSTDNTIEIANSCKNERITIFSEKDNGIYEAMNKGIDLAKGKWIYFLGSDDQLYDQNVLNDFYKYIEGKNLDFVYGNVLLQSNKLTFDGEFDKKKIFTESNICHQAIFYNKDIFAKLGKYNLEYKLWADWDLNIRLFSYPDFRPFFYNRTVAKYNDKKGTSANTLDESFKEILPAVLIQKIKGQERILNMPIVKWSIRLFKLLKQ